MTRSRNRPHRAHAEADVPLWTEALFGAELLLLHATPVYYGFGVPQGDDSGVVVIPGFLGTDLYLMELHAWLARIGYRPYFSGIGINAECPNLLIQRRLNETIDTALAETGRRVHLIGHSLGGVLARSVANQRPKDVASVITLASPIRGTVMHRSVLSAAEAVRIGLIHGHCTLEEFGAVTAQMVAELLAGKKHAQTAIKSLLDSVARPTIDQALMEDTARRLADIRATPEAQAALSDFLSR